MILNLGSGDQILDGWENVDFPDVDLMSFPWKWEDNSIDQILASHILEHFTRQQGVWFLDECRRILKPGGTIFIAVPDMDLFIDCRIKDDWDAVAGYHWRDLNFFMGGDGSEEDELMCHKYMYCFASLAWTMKAIGFRRVVKVSGAYPFNPRWNKISLHMKGIK